VDEAPLREALHFDECRANSSHIRQSRPDSGLGSQVKVLEASTSCSLLARKRRRERWTQNPEGKLSVLLASRKVDGRLPGKGNSNTRSLFAQKQLGERPGAG
jgi:hypothetical protein